MQKAQLQWKCYSVAMPPKPRLEKNRIGLRLKLLLVVVLAMLMMWAMLALFFVRPD